jgi:hypothetical protein
MQSCVGWGTLPPVQGRLMRESMLARRNEGLHAERRAVELRDLTLDDELLRLSGAAVVAEARDGGSEHDVGLSL